MQKPENFLDQALNTSKKSLKYVLLFSMASNILMLALPLYTLQVLDRYVSTQSNETLFFITLITLFCIVMFGMFQLIRSLVLVKLSEWMDGELSENVLRVSLIQANYNKNSGGSQNLRDLNTVKQFLTGPGLSALFDAPWSVVYLLVLLLIHPLPFFLTLVGGIFLLFIAVLNERATNKALGAVNDKMVRNMSRVDMSARNAEVIAAMGMEDAVVNRWKAQNAEVVGQQTVASNRGAVITNTAKAFRMILQIAVVASGAWLFTQNAVSMGAIIACSILASRALAPFEQAIGAWSSMASFRKSMDRLRATINAIPLRQDSIALPVPEGNVSVEKLVFMVPGTNQAILKGINFEIKAGETLGIIGPSAAGKSTLAKLMMGIWKPNSGAVRLDGADVFTWRRDQFGEVVGYLPQDVELFDGTIRENISRMREDAKDEDIVAAAKMSGAHEMILRFPNGYDTPIGATGASLSGGQRQRIGLARAFYGNPKLIILDEPNSNLDDAGEGALSMAIRNAKSLKITTVIVAHRPSVLGEVDKILVVNDGLVADFGPAKEILAKYTQRGIAAAEQAKKAQQIQQQKAQAAKSGEQGAAKKEEYGMSANVKPKKGDNGEGA